MIKRRLVLVFFCIFCLVVAFMSGHITGQQKGEARTSMLRFGALVMGISLLEDIQKDEISSAERKIRLHCYLKAWMLLENERGKYDNLLSVYARELWDAKQKTNSENDTVTEKRFDQIVRQRLAVDPAWGVSNRLADSYK